MDMSHHSYDDELNVNIIDKELSNQLYDYLIYVFNYKLNVVCRLRNSHIYQMARGIGVSYKQLVTILSICKWCSVQRESCIFRKRYNICIYSQ
jgi:hypothetical protein